MLYMKAMPPAVIGTIDEVEARRRGVGVAEAVGDVADREIGRPVGELVATVTRVTCSSS